MHRMMSVHIFILTNQIVVYLSYGYMLHETILSISILSEYIHLTDINGCDIIDAIIFEKKIIEPIRFYHRGTV